jgi:hypothetical protein
MIGAGYRRVLPAARLHQRPRKSGGSVFRETGGLQSGQGKDAAQTLPVSFEELDLRRNLLRSEAARRGNVARRAHPPYQHDLDRATSSMGGLDARQHRGHWTLSAEQLYTHVSESSAQQHQVIQPYSLIFPYISYIILILISLYFQGPWSRGSHAVPA